MQVLVLQYFPALDQEAVRVVVRAGNVAQVALCDQAACYRGAGADELFGGEAFKLKWVPAHVEPDAVHRYLLADIAGDQVGIEAIFAEVVILAFGTFIGEVKRFANRRLDLLVVGVKRKEILVESADMIPGLDRDIGLAVGSERFQRLAVREDIDMTAEVRRRAVALPYRKTTYNGAGNYQQIAEPFDMPESGIDIFEMCKHKPLLNPPSLIRPPATFSKGER